MATNNGRMKVCLQRGRGRNKTLSRSVPIWTFSTFLQYLTHNHTNHPQTHNQTVKRDATSLTDTQTDTLIVKNEVKLSNLRGEKVF